ncbi:WXG100 family type VII secretion target [Streptomyces europaeiscabiei]|uniref:WXG100 family type VII secretion target n=1 Tax=Streptomyces europaeiscabiei TaxID=146819 RepID=A0ABU4NJB1_9ACTN|nr:WXG100 family type VII secretion target [Streptomyces europaeiscabiei]MDX2761164.1 WXG100 family type VII secretion target [Streptomyces europaeiscabiei]MDX3548842.1 WXG100 family type VII secretion target [Streptomyces europaeiscabiei]MDX3555783.1 WXG100 family type VII secretion target [Streptomyces europaeiscabiei]MDX3703225.1 WXG100 family type VII secretion target [Streptomyces europaeiscabiei]MDX3784643.1 WXG100 family type VII secretion target [Streptomyces europaeiscabiei]
MAGSQKQKLENDAVVLLQKQMLAKYENVKSRVHRLQGIIDSLETGQWDGIGRAAFDKKQFEINQSLRSMGNILAEVIEAMTSARNIIDTKEDEVRAAVNRIDIQDGAPTVSPLSSY